MRSNKYFFLSLLLSTFPLCKATEKNLLPMHLLSTIPPTDFDELCEIIRNAEAQQKKRLQTVGVQITDHVLQYRKEKRGKPATQEEYKNAEDFFVRLTKNAHKTLVEIEKRYPETNKEQTARQYKKWRRQMKKRADNLKLFSDPNDPEAQIFFRLIETIYNCEERCDLCMQELISEQLTSLQKDFQENEVESQKNLKRQLKQAIKNGAYRK